LSERTVRDPRIDDYQDMIENSPCGYLTLQTNGRIELVNKTLLGWVGRGSDEMIGKRFSDFLNMAGRIYYETHLAPLLRMQGYFNEFAIEMVTADGGPI
jgi:phosphoserine phosphatase RsbU/P